MPLAEEPAAGCGNGWWRVANRSKQLWPGGRDLLVEARDRNGVWASVEVVDRVDVAGRVRVAGRVAEAVRVTSSFLPLEPLLEADGWEMEIWLVAPTPTLALGAGGSTVQSKLVSTSVLLSGVDGTVGEAPGPFYVSLPTNQGAYHAVATAAISDGDVLRVTCDPASCRHVAG